MWKHSFIEIKCSLFYSGSLLYTAIRPKYLIYVSANIQVLLHYFTIWQGFSQEKKKTKPKKPQKPTFL